MRAQARLVCISPGHAVSLARKAGSSARADDVEVDLSGLERDEIEDLARWALRQQIAVDDAVQHLHLTLAA